MKLGTGRHGCILDSPRGEDVKIDSIVELNKTIDLSQGLRVLSQI